MLYSLLVLLNKTRTMESDFCLRYMKRGRVAGWRVPFTGMHSNIEVDEAVDTERVVYKNIRDRKVKKA